MIGAMADFKKVEQNLKDRGYTVTICETKEEAAAFAVEQIPQSFEIVNVLPVQIENENRFLAEGICLHGDVDHPHQYRRKEEADQQILFFFLSSIDNVPFDGS